MESMILKGQNFGSKKWRKYLKPWCVQMREREVVTCATKFFAHGGRKQRDYLGFFRTKFLAKYFPTNVRHVKEMEFLQLKQGGMSIGEYVAKFESLSKFSRYFQLQPNEEWKCRKFEESLWYEIREVVVPLEIREFPTLLNKCRMVEDIKKSREGRPRDFGPSRFQKRDDNLKKKPYTRPPGSIYPHSNYGSKGGSSEMQSSLVRCWATHETKNCPIKEVICFKCNKPGRQRLWPI